MIDFSKYTYLYNADAHFKALERFPDGFFEALIQQNIEGFNAVCWGLAEMSMQGELVRRYQGLDKGEYLTEDKVRHMIGVSQLPEAVKILVETINKGMAVDDADEEIDEVLAELQKKTTSASQNLNT